MNQLKDLPDLGRPLRLLRLMDELRKVSDNTIIGFAIQHRLQTKGMDRDLLETIWSQYQDNKQALINVVGEEAILLIKEVLQ
jgi:uncharacterized protein (UPF0218 family)